MHVLGTSIQSPESEELITCMSYRWPRHSCCLWCGARLLCCVHHHHNHNHFMALFPGPPGWAGARRELLDFMVQGKINRGRHTDHPAGRHSIQTNQCPPPSFPHFFVLCTAVVNWHFYSVHLRAPYRSSSCVRFVLILVRFFVCC